ncbi:glycosyl transferase family 2, partial [filamentous cyanobacterium CCP1]
MSHSFLAIRVLRSVPARLWLSSFLLLLGCVWLIPHGDFRQAESFPVFCIGIGLMSAGFLLSWGLRSIPGIWFWGVTILARILLLPMYPGDDVWRYLWEGYIQTLGFSPYHFAPNAIELIPYRTEWWSQINHLDVSAIYPPIAQLGFRTLAFISPTVLLFKLAFIFADLSICWLLSRQFGNRSTLLYAWNPLILYSFAGADHYDSWFMLPLVAAWLMGYRMESSGQLGKVKPEVEQPNADRLWMGSAFLVGISIAIKWMSLPVLGFLSWQAWKRGGVKRVGWVI